MTAAEREHPEPSVPAEAPRSDMDDPPETLSPSYPLHEALEMSAQLLRETHERSRAAAAGLAARLRSLNLWAVGAGTAALGLLGIEIFFPSWVPSAPAVAMNSIRIAGAAAGLAALAALAWSSIASISRKSLLELHRAERCRLLKYRFLVDPSVWTRRGGESSDRRDRFRREAGEIAAMTGDRVSEWASRDTVAFAPTLPVGSGIDSHTVHTLVDYYQERRLNPRLDELGRAIGRAPSGNPLWKASSALFFAAVALAAAHLLLQLPLLAPSSASRVPRETSSSAAAALAIFLPALAMALRLSPGRAGLPNRASVAGAHHALSELSGRLQKASGAEAIFRELGFCEDVLETHHREWLRSRLRDLSSIH